MSAVLFIVVWVVGLVVGYAWSSMKSSKKISSQEKKIEQLTISLTDARQEVERKEDELATLYDNFNMVNSELSELKAKCNN